MTAPSRRRRSRPGGIHGFHDGGNADWFKFSTTAASVICIEVLSSRNGVLRNEPAYYKPRLNFFNTDGATLRASVDDLLFHDPQLCVRVPGAGTWFVEVTEASAGGDAEYQLSLGITAVDTLPSETEPNDTSATADGVSYGNVFQGTTSTADTDFFTFSGAAGDQVLIEVLPGTVGTPLAVTFFAPDGVTPVPGSTTTYGGITTARTILTSTGLQFFRLTSVSAAAVPFSLSFARRSTSAFEAEPNGTRTDANFFATTNRASGVIATPGDTDFFRFDAEENELVILAVLARSVTRGGIYSNGHRAFSGHGSALQPRLRIQNGAGGTLATSFFTAPDDCAGTEDIVDGLPSAAVAFIAPAAGTYYLEVTAENGTSGTDHFYLVRRR
ncbi:MAG: hypothetical protein HC813_00895 [Planctomycetes bacterium]|nr:hypothetical protein [Planctomycetota bacterium]